jgi:spore germination cell wall hydrolase CwlJ-like protein
MGAITMTTESPPPPAIVTYEHKIATIAAVLMAETGGGWNKMRAVAQVIANRKGDSYRVVMKPKQFSCLNRRTPEQLIAKWKPRERLSMYGFSPSIYFAQELLHGWGTQKENDVGNATHYHSTKIKPPYWARGKKPVANIGGHLFYKLP